jgi:hypothetical protein
MRSVSLLVLACLLGGPVGQTATTSAPRGCQIGNKNYYGWKAVSVSNPWITLMIVPQLGGRLMQVTFGGHDYLWVNDQLKGQYFSPDISAARKRWFNYGGDKIWPMPEGSSDEQHWPGAVGSRLDAGTYAAEILSRDATCAVRLVGPPDPFTGQQYVRDISIGADSPVISFRAVMKNVSGYPQTWSEQSVSQYTTEDPQNPGHANSDFWGLTPANPQSVYQNSYHVRTASASSAGYTVRDGLFAVHTIDAAGEVWVDSPGEWLAVIDGATKYTMVERFRYQRSADYPGQATVIFYTTRPPGAQPTTQPSSPIFYMEAEINSPMVRLDPGATYAMDTQWFPTRMGSELTTATYAGVVGRPLSAVRTSDDLMLTGSFGAFFEGYLEVRFYDETGSRVGAKPVQEVRPTELVALQQVIQAPAEATRVSLHLIDRHGSDRGPLGEVTVTPRAAR